MYSDKPANDRPLSDEPLGVEFAIRYVGLLLAYGATALLFGSVYTLVVALIARTAGTIFVILGVIGTIGSLVVLRLVLRRIYDRWCFDNAHRS